MTSKTNIPPLFNEAVRAYQTRLYRLTFLGWAVRACVAFIIPCLISLALDRFWDFPVNFRVFLLAASCGVPLLTLSWLLGQPIWESREDVFAGMIDRDCPDLRDGLRSSMNLAEREIGSFMLAASIAKVESSISVGRARTLVDWGLTPRWAAGLFGLLASIAFMAIIPLFQLELLLNRFFDPWGNYPRPSFTRIVLDVPESLPLTQGDDYILNVHLEGSVTPGMGCYLHRKVVDDAAPSKGKPVATVSTQILPMSPMPNNRYAFRIKGLAKPFDYFITAGDGRTKILDVQMIRRPRITGVKAQYKYPRYTRLPEEEKELKVKEIKAIEGTRVRMFLKTDLPIKESHVQIGAKRIKIRWDRDRTNGDFMLRLEKSEDMTIHLVADNGTDNKFDTPYSLKAVQDNPPTVGFIETPRQLTVFRDDLIHFSYQGFDDFGIEEVYLRYKHEGTRETKALSLEFPKAGVKKFNGEAVIEVNELIDRGPYGPPADGFELSLIMTDGKDQEGATQKLNFQVITDSPDRQLADLLNWLDEFDKRGMKQTVETLRSQSTQVKILIEGMGDDTEFTDKHQQRLDGILRNLTRMRIADPFSFIHRQGSVYRYGYYPRREGRASEEIMTLPHTLLTADDYGRVLEKSKGQKLRKKALLEFQALLDDQRTDAEAFRGMLLNAIRENQLQLVSYLADTWIAETHKVEKTEDATIQEAVIEKQRDRLENINKLVIQIGEFENVTANEHARTALKAAEAEDLDAAKKAFSQLLEDLRSGTELDGHFQNELWTWLSQNPPSKQFARARATESAHHLAMSRLKNVVFRGDNANIDEAQFLQDCMAYQAYCVSNDKLRESLFSLSAAMEGWQQTFDLYSRCWLLERDIREHIAVMATGQSKRGDAVARKRILDIREAYLALIRDIRTDMFAGVGDVRKGIESLNRHRNSFIAWNGVPEILSPKNVNTILQELADFTNKMRDHTLDGLKNAKPAFAQLLTAVSQNLASEIPRIESEQVALLEEVAEAGGDRLDLISDTERKRMLRDREFGRKGPKHERLTFTEQFIHRLTACSISAGQAIDFMEKVWALDPTNESTEWVNAAENVSELLRTFAERAYDKTGQIYGANRLAAKGYPGILNEVHKNLEELKPDLLTLVKDLAALGSNEPQLILQRPNFDKRLAVIHKTKPYRETLRWLGSHTKFLNEDLILSDPKALDVAVANFSTHPQDKVPYWRSLYSLLRQLSSQQEFSLNNTSDWTEAFTRKVTQVHMLLRGMETLPSEMKLLTEALGDYPSLIKNLNDRANFDADGRADLQADLEEWQGTLVAVMNNIEDKLDREPLNFRPRRRYGTSPRFDLNEALKLIIRDEARWLKRVKEEQEHTIANRFATVLAKASGSLPANAREDAAWQFSNLLSRRRRSMSAQSIQSAGIPWDLGEGEGRKPKMPEYLYKELKRAMNRNYPQQFKQMGLKYLKDLSEDSF